TIQRPDPAILLRRIAERLDGIATAVGAEAPHLLADASFLAAIGRLELRDDTTQWVGDAARGGFVGSATLVGAPDDLARIIPVLQWGAALGVGKGTLQGAGRFVVGPVPPTARIVLQAKQPQPRPSPVASKPGAATRHPARSSARPRDRKRKQ
ncbi:MAG: CRISPR system precrRNA processing endoribonuclease RAMP protein Cas6, partial [Thermomicrobia bacterium]|nr:CRISPR system precrRNA processing endoribonuclease RAMP protein Cas6 [Thermomicrobia bacterium]